MDFVQRFREIVSVRMIRGKLKILCVASHVIFLTSFFELDPYYLTLLYISDIYIADAFFSGTSNFLLYHIILFEA
jgi:hypothetical protein